jgi:glycogen debranching enzyme
VRRQGGVGSVPSVVSDAVVIKDDNLFFLVPPDGQVSTEERHAYGLYYRDCRYLSGYQVTLGPDISLEPLLSPENVGNEAVFNLYAPDFLAPNGHVISKEHLQIEWVRQVEGPNHRVCDCLHFNNRSLDPLEFPILFQFDAKFEDIFVVRGERQKRKGRVRFRPSPDGMLFCYSGVDGVSRKLTITCTPKPNSRAAKMVRYRVTVQPKACFTLNVVLSIEESENQPTSAAPSARFTQLQSRDRLTPHARPWASVKSDNILFNRIIRRAILDLKLLRSSIGGYRYFAAGIPWFVTLFGRDSLVTALLTLAIAPDMTADTLRLLACLQGQRVNKDTDEEPGKIPHELRLGEMARTRQIPHTPSYSTIDATIIFLILLVRHAWWTGSLNLFMELQENIEHALTWMNTYGDIDGDGYLEYRNGTYLENQGWKDSGDGILSLDGQPVQAPIALVEVQGFAYMARFDLADLYRRAGKSDKANQLIREATRLKERFNRDFWMEDRQCYALALDANKKQCALISSNPGQAMWTGIVDDQKAKFIADRLMATDMFSGWGVRTLSASGKAYNPIGYHLGTVWPHDNALIAAGFRRYGYDQAADQICDGIFEASIEFDHYRLPEVFAGCERKASNIPIRYPGACHPHAWSAASLISLLESSLGFFPNAFDGQLRLVRPTLPSLINSLEVDQLRVGDASVDLRFVRHHKTIEVEVLNVNGQLKVISEQ